MKKTTKRGFTIVELVIVIAVIAILAAVLIPTFSNIINKANLSADKQAVRAMNQALADWEALNGYAKPADIESVMQVLANAGYNTDNWACLTSGYQVYWFKNDNRMILYNAATASIEYPEDYVGTKVMITSENGFFIYNENHVKAQQFDMGLSSAIAKGETLSGSTSISSAKSITSKTDINGNAINSNESNNLSKISSVISTNAEVEAALKSAAKVENTTEIKYYATREVVSATDTSVKAYASLQISAVGSETELKSSGEMKENLYYLSIVNVDNAGTTEQIAAAKKAAGEYIYNVFDQMTTGKVVSNATIIVEAGTELDCSTCEWAPCKTFSGYFGSTDETKPVVINGARLTSATGHASTVAFNGSGSKYFVTGFFGTVYGTTTIENVTFKNITIDTPANDYTLTESDRGAKLVSNRNTVGIIGGITDGYDAGQSGLVANVTIKNVTVESSCALKGAGCIGGLVGYIGSANSNGILTGNITIDNCAVHASVESTDNMSSNGYKAAGGIIGFTCRVDTGLNIAINNCTYDGKISGYGAIGAVAGAFQNDRNVTINGGEYDKCTLDVNKSAISVNSIAGYCENPGTIVVTGSPVIITTLNASSDSSYKTYYVIGEGGKLTKK